jgi:acid phosphatase
MLENGDFDQAVAMAFVRKHQKEGVVLTAYYALAHPSRPNYVGLISGSTDGTNGDCEPKKSLSRPHLGDALEDKGLNWRVYAEYFPEQCGLGLEEDYRTGYARRHVPFLDFSDVQTKARSCKHIVREDGDAHTLKRDLAAQRFFDYALYIPNNWHNGHHLGFLERYTQFLRRPIGIAEANHWLNETIEPQLQDAAFTKGRLFILTFDENDDPKENPNDKQANRVFVMLWGDSVDPATSPNVLGVPYDHYNLLRTIEDALGVNPFGVGDAASQPIVGIWRR